MKFKFEFSLFEDKEPDKLEINNKTHIDKDGNTTRDIEEKITVYNRPKNKPKPKIKAQPQKVIEVKPKFTKKQIEEKRKAELAHQRFIAFIVFTFVISFLIFIVIIAISDSIKKKKHTKAALVEQIDRYAQERKADEILAEETYQKAIALQEDAELVGPEQKEAFELFYKAAELDHAESQYQLGECFLWGLGTKSDINSAFVWFEKAAKRNSPGAQWRIATAYIGGYYYEKDENKGFELLQKSADQGYKPAIDLLK